MITVGTTFSNYQSVGVFSSIFKNIPEDFIFDDGVLYSKNPPKCPVCGETMVHNGSNTYTKKDVCTLKIGKYHCLHCNTNSQTSVAIFKKLVRFIQNHIIPLLVKMRYQKVSYRGIEDIMYCIFPMGKDTIFALIKSAIERSDLPKPEETETQIIGYDEQFPFVNGKPRVRITIFDIISGLPYIDTIDQSKSSETIKSIFRRSGISFTKPTIVITDLDKSYPTLLNELFGDNLLHQPCLFHLQQLICKEFSKICSIHDEILKYQFLNVFYNHDDEIKWLTKFLETEKEMLSSGTKKQYSEWLRSIKSQFTEFLKGIRNLSKREKHGSKIRSFAKIMEHQLNLMENINQFSPKLQKRLEMMSKKFVDLTNFCGTHNIPTTNNAIENYFFRTLNMNWKRRMRTDEGLINNLKLQAMRIHGVFSDVKITIPNLFCALRDFLPT